MGRQSPFARAYFGLILWAAAWACSCFALYDDMGLSINGFSDRLAGYVGDATFTVTNFPIPLNASHILTFTTPATSWGFSTFYQSARSSCDVVTTAGGAIVKGALTFDSRSYNLSPTNKNSTVKAGTVTIKCSNVMFPPYALSAGYNRGDFSLQVMMNKVSIFSKTLDGYESSYGVAPADLGDKFRKVTFDEYGQLSVLFTLPFPVSTSEIFFLTLDKMWYSVTTVNCSFAGTPTTQTSFTLEGNNAVLKTRFDAAVSVDKNVVNVFACGGFTAPVQAAKTYASMGITSGSGAIRARTDQLEVPAFDNALAAARFAATLDSTVTGAPTRISVAVSRFPQAVEANSRIILTFPTDITFGEEANCTVSMYRGEGFVNQLPYSVIPSTSVIAGSTVTITVTKAIPSALSVTRFNCTNTIPTVVYDARSLIGIEVQGPASTTPIMKRATGGLLPATTAAELGVVNRVAVVADNKAGATGDLQLTVKPLKVAMVLNDSIVITMDSRFRFSTNTVCNLLASNENTNYMNQNGDLNVPVSVSTSYSPAIPYRINVRLNDTRERQIGLMHLPETYFTVKCSFLTNPLMETGNTTQIDVATVNSEMRTKAAFGASIVSTIMPNILGANVRKILHSSPWKDQVGTLTVTISELVNPVPSAFERGAITFQMPLGWSFNALLQSTVCTISGSYPSGTTSISSGYMYHTVTFAPNTGLPKGAYTLTCTNVKTPSMATGERADLSIITMSDTMRIDMTTNAVLQAVTDTKPISITRASVLHTLVFNKYATFSATELAVYTSVYDDILQTISCKSGIKGQDLRGITNFKPPSRIVGVTIKSATTSAVSTLSVRAREEGLEHAEDVLSVSPVHMTTMNSDSERYLVVATYVNTTSESVSQADIANYLSTNFAVFSSKVYSALGYRPVDGIDGGSDNTGTYPSHCSDSIMNEDETDTDCGGSCAKCANRKMCRARTDCKSSYCVNNVCEGPSSDASRMSLSELSTLLVMLVAAFV